MKIEFLNINDDEKLDPEIKPVKLSHDKKNKPPAYCLPWVEATRYSIQLKSNADYVIRKTAKKIKGWILEDGKEIPMKELYINVPEGVGFVPLNKEEHFEKKIRVSKFPAFSSPWQRKHKHSITLKLGVCWWTPPGWGLFITSAPHRNEDFRVVEGYVRTDIWHRDIPIIVTPSESELKIPKYGVIASAIVVPAEDPELVSVEGDPAKKTELVKQISSKRLNPSIYKKLLR